MTIKTHDHQHTRPLTGVVKLCAWCPYTQARPAQRAYGSIPLCARCYRYATQADEDTRRSLNVAWTPRKVRAA